MAAGDPISASETALANRKIVFRANRATNSSTSTGTEVGVLRVDDQIVEGGRVYDLRTSGVILDSSVAGDVGIIRIRATTDGSTPTTSSAEIGADRTEVYAVANEPIRSFSTLYIPGASDVILSVIMTVQRAAGTGAVGLLPAIGGMHLWLIDLGPDTGDVGVDL